SGGKDSQAALIEVAKVVPRDLIIVIHATLGEVEWPGALELARDHAAALGVPFLVAKAIWKDGSEKSFLGLVEDRFAKRPEVPSWPSKAQRRCTSELKTGPIEREIRHYLRDHGLSLIVNVTGIRAAESPDRAKAEVFKLNARNSVAGREWYDWL